MSNRCLKNVSCSLYKRGLIILISSVLIQVPRTYGEGCWRDLYYRVSRGEATCPNPTHEYLNGNCYELCEAPINKTVLDPGYCNACPEFFVMDSSGICNCLITSTYPANQANDLSGCITQAQHITSRNCYPITNVNGVTKWVPYCIDGFTYDGYSACVMDVDCPTGYPGKMPNCQAIPAKRTPAAKATCPSSDLNPGTLTQKCFSKCLANFDYWDHSCLGRCPPEYPVRNNLILCTKVAVTPGSIEDQVSAYFQQKVKEQWLIADSQGMVVEDILMSKGDQALSIANTVCYKGTNMTEYVSQRKQKYECNKRRFPFWLANGVNITNVQNIDVDQNGNIGFCGKSTNRNFVYNEYSIFVGMLPSTGFEYKFVLEFSYYYSQLIQSFKFNSRGTHLVLLTRDPSSTPTLTLISTNQSYSTQLYFTKAFVPIISYLDGAETILGIVPDSIYINLVSSKLSGTKYLIFTIIDEEVLLSDQVTSLTFPTMVSDESHYIKAFGYFQDKFIILTHSWQQPYLASQIIIAYSNGLFITEQSARISAPYQGKHIQFVTDNTNNQDYFLAVYNPFPSAGCYGILISRDLYGDTSTPKFWTFTENVDDTLSILDYLALTPFTAKMLYINDLTEEVILMTLTFYEVSSTQINVQKTKINHPGIKAANLYAAFIESTGRNFYLGGMIQNYGTCLKGVEGANSYGFITQTGIDNQCEPFWFNVGAAYNFSANGSVSWAVLFRSVVYNAQNLTFGYYGSYGLYFPSYTLHNVINQCCTIKQTMIEPMSNICFNLDDNIISETQYIGFTQDVCLDQFLFTNYNLGHSLLPVGHSYNQKQDLTLQYEIVPDLNIEFGASRNWWTAQLPNYQLVEGSNFSTYVYGNGQIIQPTVIPSLTYIIGDQKEYISWSPFYTISSYSTLILYKLQWQTTSGWVAYPNSANFFKQFPEGTDDETIEVYLTDNSLVGIYNFRIIGYMIDFPCSEPYSEFQVILLHQCTNTILQPSQFPQQEYFLKFDSVTVSTLVIPIKGWTESIGICQPITYKLGMESGVAVPKFISMKSNKILAVSGSSTEIGQFDITLTGSIEAYRKAQTIKTKITVVCVVYSISFKQNKATLDHYMGGETRFALPTVDVIPPCEYPIILQGVNLPSFIKMKDGQVIVTSSQGMKAMYTITIIAQIGQDGPFKQTKIDKFTLSIYIRNGEKPPNKEPSTQNDGIIINQTDYSS
ncbi:hypothetical protein FGO68_gene1584 [Halteria grandinella]|uniref:Uncharacterized protein n=1 Tax=Halteria grandinella TaxID=5974 RepID=A0A8J8P823_HALGN|nr:hypothetical protein FGO68_gene1584 [Halteria grandinella]